MSQLFTNEEIKDAVEYINKKRKENKDQWYSGYIISAKSPTITFKGYNTWLQVLDIKGVRYGTSTPHKKVREFKAYIETVLGYVK